MQYMYVESTQFDQCLSIWAAKTPENVNTTSMLLYTDCPNERDTPPPDYGPWCRNGADFRTHECTNHEEPEVEEKQEDHHEEKRAKTISRSSTHISEDRQ